MGKDETSTVEKYKGMGMGKSDVWTDEALRERIPKYVSPTGMSQEDADDMLARIAPEHLAAGNAPPDPLVYTLEEEQRHVPLSTFLSKERPTVLNFGSYTVRKPHLASATSPQGSAAVVHS